MDGEGEDGDAVSVGRKKSSELEDDALSTAERAGELVDDEEDVGERGVLRRRCSAGIEAGDGAHRADLLVCGGRQVAAMSWSNGIDEVERRP